MLCSQSKRLNKTKKLDETSLAKGQKSTLKILGIIVIQNHAGCSLQYSAMSDSSKTFIFKNVIVMLL